MHIYEKSRPTGKVSGIMANTIELKQQIAQGEYDAAFAKLYGADAVQEQRKRYTCLLYTSIVLLWHTNMGKS